tara:strand:- start:586 stop:816 length:231 start_codon:yes stop_codon:yes gene_type:complete
MEMLNKILIGIIGFFSTLSVGFIGWVGISIIDLKTELAETHGKVAANYEMIKPMWQAFLAENGNGDIAQVYRQAND